MIMQHHCCTIDYNSITERGQCPHNVALSETLSRSLFYWLSAIENGNHRFYRAMHFSAKRGLAIAYRLSVRPSVTHGRRQDFCCVGAAWGQNQGHRWAKQGMSLGHLAITRGHVGGRAEGIGGQLPLSPR